MTESDLHLKRVMLAAADQRPWSQGNHWEVPTKIYVRNKGGLDVSGSRGGREK